MKKFWHLWIPTQQIYSLERFYSLKQQLPNQMIPSVNPKNQPNSRTPHSMVNPTSPKQPSRLMPCSDVMNEEFTLGRLNTIQEVTEPSSSKINSGYKSSQILAPRFAPTESNTSSGRPSTKQSKYASETSDLQSSTNPYRHGFKLNPIEQQQEQERRKSSNEPQTFRQKLQKCWQSMNCCKKDTRYQGTAPSW